MPATDLNAKRTARRKMIESDDDLTPLEKTLVLGIHEHGDDMVDTMERGFSGMQSLGKIGLVGMFILGLVVVLMLGQSRGVDVGATSKAVREVAGAARGIGSSALAEEAPAVPPSAQPE